MPPGAVGSCETVEGLDEVIPHPWGRTNLQVAYRQSLSLSLSLVFPTPPDIRFQQEEHEEEGAAWLVFPRRSQHGRRGGDALEGHDGVRRRTRPEMARAHGAVEWRRVA